MVQKISSNSKKVCCVDILARKLGVNGPKYAIWKIQNDENFTDCTSFHKQCMKAK